MKKLFAFILMLTLALGVSVSAADISLDAAAGISVNAVTGEVYCAKEPALEHAMASTTKIMTALLTIENVDLQSRTPAAIKSDLVSGSLMGLVEGEQLKVIDALYGLMLPSGNDAAMLLARTVGGSYEAFSEMMNAKAAELGCENTCFTTPSGLDAPGHYTTAADYAKIANYAMQYEAFRDIVSTTNYTVPAEPAYGVIEHVLANTNYLLPGMEHTPDYTYDGVYGIKTGTTDAAKACIVAAAEKDGTELISLVFGAPYGSPKDVGEPNRFTEITKLLDKGFETAAVQPYTVTVEGSTLTATNPTTGYVMTATISAPDVALTGTSVEPAIVTTTYPEGTNWHTNWDITYTDNDKIGTATASISFGGKTVSCEFEIVDSTVTLTENKEVDSLVVPAGQTYDLGGNVLTVKNGLVVNKGGEIVNGVLNIADGAAVSLGDNGGWVPVLDADYGTNAMYVLYPAAIKAGKTVTSTAEGTKYTFGYKLSESGVWTDSYGAAIEASETGNIKFGVALTLDGTAADYSFSHTSVEKMAGIDDAASSDEFFKVNLSLAGVNNALTKVRVAPVIKVPELGFRCVGEATGEGSGEIVARINTEGYYTLEDAVAAAATADELTVVKLVGDIEFKRPVTIKTDGNTRFTTLSRSDIEISGPVTFDGTGVNAKSLLFRVYGSSTLTLKDGVTVQNYANSGDASSTDAYGAIVRVEGTSFLNMDGVTVRNCSGAARGALYVTGTSVVDIRNCSFENNTAVSEFGGAISSYSGTSLNVENCTFTGNTAATFGGAVCVRNNDAVTLKNNTYTNNTCGTAYRGGAIAATSSFQGELTIDGAVFSGNTIDDIGIAAGTIALDGTVEGLSTIKLSAGKYIAVGDAIALDETASVSVMGADGTIVLTGAQINAGNYITENGMAEEMLPPVAKVGTKEYTSLAAAIKATENVTSATTIELFADDTITEATTVTLNPNVQIKVTSDAVVSGPLTIEGNNKAHTAALPFLIDACKLTLKNGVTLQNIKNEYAQNYCGMIRVQNSGELEFDGVTVTGCTGTFGLIGGQSNTKSFTLKNSTFKNNTGATGSGSVLFNYGGPIVLENCVFEGNKSAVNGGVVHLGNASGTLTAKNCTFKDNSATGSGGAISGNAFKTLTMEDCTFTGNSSGSVGGAIWINRTGSSSKFTDCTFTDNTSGKQGGAMCISSAATKATVAFNGVSMNGNKANSATTATANGISYMGGSLSLAGAIDVDVIALNSGLIITLDENATFAKNVTVAGPSAGTLVFSGSKVSEYYQYFTHIATTLSFDSTGKCVAK